ncbi:hypothetical protein VPH35_084968 [Triticum aestivum]
MSEEEAMESNTAFSQHFAAKRLREVANTKINDRKREYINETGFGDLMSISPFTAPHDLMEWITMNIETNTRELSQNKVIVFTRDMVKKVFNIPSGNRLVELFKRLQHCELRNIYHKNGRAPIAHTVDVLHRAGDDDGDTTKRSWVLLALATVLSPSTGNMLPLEYLKSLEDMDKVIYMDHLVFPQAAINEHQLNYSLLRACFFLPLSKTPYAALPAQGHEGNNSEVAQDQHVSDNPDCGDTQDRGAENINIEYNQDDMAAKHNPIEGSNPTEDGKSIDGDLPSHLAAIYEKHTKLFSSELKGALRSFGQVLQAIHCKRMGQLLKDVHAALPSSQEAADVSFDMPPPGSNDVDKSDHHGCTKETSSRKRKAADEPTTDKVVECAEGARSNHASSSAHECNGSNVVEKGTRTSPNAKYKVSSGEDIEHGHQLSQRNQSVHTSVAGHWSDAPSMCLFQEGTKEYDWWISVQSQDGNSNAPPNGNGNTATTPKSCAVFDVTPRAPISIEAQALVFDVTPISMAPLSSGVVEELVVLVSSREPSPDLNKEKLKCKDEKKLKSKKRVGSPMSAGSKYTKIKTDSKMEAMYQYYAMKRYKMKRGEIEPPFIKIGDFHITYPNFHKSLKPHAQTCNEVMSLFSETFNIEQLSSSKKQKKFAFSVLMSLQLSVHPEVFDTSVCARELRKACQNFQISGFDLIVCVVKLLHEEFNMFDSLDDGKLDVAARNLFINFKRTTKESDFTGDLFSFKTDWPLLDYPQQATHFDCGLFSTMYLEIFDGQRMEDFKKQNMLDVWKTIASKPVFHPLHKVFPADVHKEIIAA